MAARTLVLALMVVCCGLEVSGMRMVGWGNGAILMGGKAIYPQPWDDMSTLTMSTSWKDDSKKTQEIEVKGKGVYEVLEEQLGPALLWTYTMEDCVFVGDPSKYCVYSDTPRTLVVIVDQRCERRTYSAERQFQAAAVSEADCQKLIKKIQADVAMFGREAKQEFPWNGPSVKTGTSSNHPAIEMSSNPFKPASSSSATAASGAGASSSDMSWMEKMRHNPWFSWMFFSS